MIFTVREWPTGHGQLVCDHSQFLKVNGQEGGKRRVVKLSEKKDSKILGTPFFLSLLLMNRRPNLGLFGPDAAPHLREKGVAVFFMLNLPF
ncbi:MAG: hypothetical protein A2026_17810 [Deltaproteobacteria bacterium RBG_19FT_COMBO_46_12]|nr:MAG: hypothetical protein A2026_17810 [Deltaproteobacteria bacterium RBG_19FT_COMBO_46_12]